MSNFSVTTVGTASAKPVVGRGQSAQVLSVHGRFFLIDCGEGVQTSLQRFKLPMMRIDSVFISHIHGDHVFGLFGFLATVGMLGRTRPMNIYGPVSLGPILKFFLSYYGEGLRFELRFTPLKMKEPEVIYRCPSLEVRAFPLNHGIETFGYIFTEREKPLNVRKEAIEKYSLSLTEIGSLKRGEPVLREDGTVIGVEEATFRKFKPAGYAYCSDTAPFPEEAAWLRGVDVIYHETTYIAARADQAAARHHSTTLDAARCALEAGARKLIIGHYSSRDQDPSFYEKECRTIFPETYAASDGDVFEINE
ncbi:MAG: ribonuclease Z [Bacteroidales bacterium]|nr:ribonuclease Z [Bacteroidales bacterium]